MNYKFLLPVFALALLLGAGCAPAEDSIDTTPASKDASMSESSQDASNLEASMKQADEMMDKEDMMDDEMKDEMSTDSSDLSFAAEATAANTAMFSWDAPESVTEADSFRILLDDEVDPSYPDQYQYWWERNYTIREHEWSDLPAGEWNARLCLWNGDECTMYSDNVALTIE